MKTRIFAVPAVKGLKTSVTGMTQYSVVGNEYIHFGAR